MVVSIILYSTAILVLMIHIIADNQEIRQIQRQYSTSICPRTLEQLYINFQISCNQPFSLIQAESFRSLIRYINPEADGLLPESPSTAKMLVMDQFTIEKEHIRQQLQGSQSCIHLSLDSWTSGNHLLLIRAEHIIDS